MAFASAVTGAERTVRPIWREDGGRSEYRSPKTSLTSVRIATIGLIAPERVGNGWRTSLTKYAQGDEGMPEPTIDDLLDQYEDIGGPETFGPEGTSILLALWRKSKKLGWKDQFLMTNTELQFQTGIKSRDTINNHRLKLANEKMIEYEPPPRGQSKGDYKIFFSLPGTAKAVRISDNYAEVDGKPVRESDHLADTVLKDLRSYTSSTTGNALIEVLEAFCTLHDKSEFHLKDAERRLMVDFLGNGIPAPFVIRVMNQVYRERSTATKITSFLYYESPIRDAWETAKTITEGVPTSPVALGSKSITTTVPISGVAIGPPVRKTKHQREMEELDRILEEERKREQIRSG